MRTEPCLFADIAWFANLSRGSSILISLDERWNKRFKPTHRYKIADVNGPISLTIPVAKPESLSNCRYGDIRLSTHGNWWHTHRWTLESGYGRTPFFEFYFPRFEKFFNADSVNNYPFLWEYFVATTQEILKLLDIEAEIKTVSSCDGRQDVVSEEVSQHVSPESEIRPYWQIRQQQFGFLPGLSILDLIFNIGPEAALYIRNLKNNIA